MLNVNIISPKDNWILQKIANELIKSAQQDIVFTQSQQINPTAQFNYYINWKFWEHLYPGLDKSNCDVVWFTHFEDNDTTRILKAADIIVAKSQHGRKCLINMGIAKDKIRVLGGIGALPLKFRKVKIGISGRPYPSTGRKGEKELIRLAGDLNKSVFQFVFSNNRWTDVIEDMKIHGADCVVDDVSFFDTIDYWLSTSYAEGGPMDVLNAFKVGIPVVSRKIGFFYSMQTTEDYGFESYDDLYRIFKLIEQAKLDKLKIMERYTWDNFRDWHADMFRGIA